MTAANLYLVVSKFETEKQEANYTALLKAKVQASLDDTRPNMPHGKVIAEACALLASKKGVRSGD